MKLKCPKHKDEDLRILRYTQLNEKKSKIGVRQGKTVDSGHVYCKKCDRTYKAKVTIS